MKDTDINDFKEMWTTELKDYSLIRVPFTEEERYVICHISNTSYVIIEDDKDAEAIVKKMIEAGVRIVTDESEMWNRPFGDA